MSRWADWIPISPEEAEDFADASMSGDDAVVALIEPLLGDNGLSELCIDKFWEPIHRCLTGDYAAAHDLDFEAGEEPLKYAVLGGEHLLSGDCLRSLSLVHAGLVPAVAVALAGIDRDWFTERFMALPHNQFHEISVDMCEEVWEQLQMLTAFYASAARREFAVFCTISH